MLLRDILKKENNNLGIFRVVAAYMVIYGHAYALSPSDGQVDFIGRMLVFDYSGSLAVKIFFFLSGLVVTNSLLDKGSLIQFTIARFFRIWPALFLVLFASSFVLGPIFSNQPIDQYFSSEQVYGYMYENSLMSIKFELPGVFSDNTLKTVNGPLWTLPYEVFAYLLLAAMFMIRLFESKILATLCFLAVLLDPLLDNKLLFTWLAKNHEVIFLAPCFAFGSCIALWKDSIRVDIFVCIGSWILFFLFEASSYNFYLFYFAVFLSILYISSQKFFIKLKPSADISYGIYLWGWPVQQIVASHFVDYGVTFNQIMSLLIVTPVGFASWYLVERKCIHFGSGLWSRIEVSSFYESLGAKNAGRC